MDLKNIILPENIDESFAVFLIRVCISVVSVAGNGLILYIAFRFNKFRASYCNGLIALLAFAEFLLGVGIMIRAVTTYYYPFNHDRFNCILIGVPAAFGIIFSQIIVLAMALDRFFAVFNPQDYFKSNNRSKFTIVTTIALVVASVFGFTALYGIDKSPVKHCSTGAAVTKFFTLAWTAYGIIIAVSIFGIYLSTVILFKKRCNVNKMFKKNRSLCLSIQLQRKVFVSISLILLCYGIFWCIPLFFIVIGTIVKVEPYIMGYVSSLIGLFSGINSCVGIFIYLAKHNEMRDYFMKIFPGPSSTMYL